MLQRSFWLSKEVFVGFFLVCVIALPVFVFGSTKAVFVDKDASGAEDGTSQHPYHSISDALDHVKNGTEVYVAKGTYRENVTLSKGVKLIGKDGDRGAVIIKAKNDNKPAITMKHQSELDHLTVSGGRYGVRVVENSKVIIYDVIVKKSNRDGIYIESAPLDKKYQISVSNTDVKNNDRAGIYVEKHNIVIINSNIISNGSDGVDFAAGTKAWLENCRFNDNKGSGLKLVLDDSEIWSKSNNVRNNGHEGVEINAYGATGNIGFKKATFFNNGQYGIARIARTSSAMNTFGGLQNGTGVNENHIEGNKKGDISPIVRGF